jgi:hypothetical protein
MIEPKQLLEYVIRPVLKDLNLWTEAAERLVLGTACQESQCGRYLKQLGTGPALGIYQMEPATHDDLWANYLRQNRWLLHDTVWDAARAQYGDKQVIDSKELIGNLFYATAMCRVHYLRIPSKIPDYLAGQAQYWKTHYNTELGAGSVQDYLNSWNRFVTPEMLV